MKDTSNKGSAESTYDKVFGPGSSAGIPSSMAAGSFAVSTTGNIAKFSAGKKSVGK